ncbi:MAG: hypothetical protein AAFY08_06850 [Planctomycetota bacterium]
MPDSPAVTLDTAPAPPTPLDSAAATDKPLRCLNCGYDLRVHPGATGRPIGDCPECGCPLAVTRRLDPLANADRRYRRGLVAGLGWLVVAVAAALPLLLPGLLLAVMAAWRLTGVERGRFEPSRDRLPRLFARWGITLGVVGLTGLAAFSLVAIVFYDVPMTGNLHSLDIALLTAGALTVTGLLSLWRHLRHVAARADDPALTARIDRLHRAWLIAIGLIGAVALIASIFDWTYQLYAMNHWASAPSLFAVVAAVLVWLWVVTLRAVARLRSRLAPIASP